MFVLSPHAPRSAFPAVGGEPTFSRRIGPKVFCTDSLLRIRTVVIKVFIPGRLKISI